MISQMTASGRQFDNTKMGQVKETNGAGGIIPPNTTLIFANELLRISE